MIKSEKEEKLKELQLYLSKGINPERFGLRDGYIYSSIITKIRFELFVRVESIGLKYPKPNIDSLKSQNLSSLISELNPEFRLRTYNTTTKNKYFIWELDTSNISYSDIKDLINSIENNFL
jgi:hypothetical protein